MKKILFITNGVSNFLTHRLPLAIKAQEEGYEVHVALPLSEAKIQKLSHLKFHFHMLPFERKGTNPIVELKVVWRIVRLLKKVKPDLLHMIAIKSILYGNIASKFVHIKCRVNAFTGLGYLFINNNFKVRCLRSLVIFLLRLNILAAKNTVTIVQNDDDAKLLLKKRVVRKKHLKIIRGSGIDLAHFKYTPEPDGEPVVVLPARLLWDKGVGEFVKAAKQLKVDYPAVRFVLVGETDPGNPAAVSNKQLHSWENSGVIEHWGWHDDMSEVFSACHLVCLPSYREGLPKVLLEAAACGRVIVTVNSPGCLDVVKDDITGLIVPVYSIDPLAKAMRELLFFISKEERIEMGKAGREYIAKNFDLKIVLDETIRLYENLMKKYRKEGND